MDKRVGLYTHEDINSEVRSAAGCYKVIDEILLEFEGSSVLCIVVGACVDNSCCGAGGACVIMIAGHAVNYRGSVNEYGRIVSEIMYIDGMHEREKVRAFAEKRFPYASQIVFLSGD